MNKYGLLVGLLVLLLAVPGYYLIKPLMYSPKDRISIAMTGRSTMKLWFKHWNWPYPLRIKMTYKDWPIAYNKYAKKNLYLEQYYLPGPIDRKKEKPFGKEMLEAFNAVLDEKKHDAVFFKFCFVDFKVGNEKSAEDRFNDLVKTVAEAYESANRRKMKLIIGNALPLPDANNHTVKLQKKFNRWLADYSAKRDDVALFDLYSPLIDGEGRLKKELARGKGDSHLNDQSFSILDERFFNDIPEWLEAGKT